MKKKLFLVMIAVIMFVGALNVYALTTNDEVSPSDSNSKMITDKATLTVQNVDADDEFYAYKILDAYYNLSTNVVSYEFTDQFNTFLGQSDDYQNFTVEEYFNLTSGDITSGSAVSTSTADKLMSAYATYINYYNYDSPSGVKMNTSSNMVTASLEAGAYLILPLRELNHTSGVFTDIYAVMLGNLDVTADNGNWVVNDEVIVAKKTDTSFTLKVGGEEDVIPGSMGVESSFNHNEVFPFEVLAKVPEFPTNMTSKEYTFSFVFDDYIELESAFSEIVIKDGDTVLNVSDSGVVTDDDGNRVATISGDLSIAFNVEYLKNKAVTIQGDARLLDSAEVGNNYIFECELVYSTSYSPFVIDRVYALSVIYTFGLELNKTDVSGNRLGNAKFDIYKDKDLKEKVGTITSSENDYTYYDGLKCGTYYLKEVAAPSGYQLLKDPIEVQVGPTDENPNDYGYTYVNVKNKKMGLLPVTGGIGLVIYAVIGVIIVSSGVGLLVYYKNKKNKVKIEDNIDVI